MATISKDRNVYRVRFTYDGKRDEVRLPGQTKRQVQIIADCVERVIAAKKSGTSLDDLTSRWLGEVDEAIFSKLFNLGLVRHRTLRFDLKRCPIFWNASIGKAGQCRKEGN